MKKKSKKNKRKLESQKSMIRCMEIRRYQKLIVWQEAHGLCLHIYKATAHFPSGEKFALVSQMRRSAYSIPTNLAEGNSRLTKKDKAHFVTIAMGSLEELHYQCLLSHDLGYLSTEDYENLQQHVGRVGYLLQRLHSSLK